MSDLEELEAELVDKFIADHDPFLLDVREPDEWAALAIPDSVNIPLAQVTRRLHEIPGEKVIVVICERGTRSERAGKYLLQQGYERVVNLVGGTTAWAATR